jgi:hypothetical protein
MHWKNVYGGYVPSYLLIKIYTEAPLTEIKNLDVKDQRVFIHEYTHFLQNISGGFGHSHIWNTYDRLRQIIAGLQKTESKQLHIPIKNGIVEEQKLFLKVMSSIEGSYAVKEIDDASANIVSVELYKDQSFEKLHPNTDITFLRLQLKDSEKRESFYYFGESAISETMAYLMETKFFGPSAINNFPYRACQKLGEWMQSEITKNEEWLFAICDLALLSNYPGRIFYQVLLEMEQDNFQPKNAEEIYEYGIGIIDKMGFDIWKDFEKNKNGAIHVMKDLFNNSIFKQTLEWFNYILETGFQGRYQNPLFMLDLYREVAPFEGFWNNIYVQFGTPQLHNSLSERFFRAPYSLKDLELEIEPLFLLSLQQIHDTLIKGNYKCVLLECCRRSTNGLETDYRCVNGPWERANDELGCAYAVLWVGYGFQEKEIIVIEGQH